jgi:hypothetical protein
MSLSTISTSFHDQQLRARIIACVMQQVWDNDTLGNTVYGKAVKADVDRAADMIWPVCVAFDVEAAYSYALDTQYPNPGGSQDVVPDSMILASVQGKWPADPA